MSARVQLRPFTPADIDALVAERQDSFSATSPEERRDRFRKQIERNPTLESDGYLALGVEGDGKLVGGIEARAPRHGFPPGVCEIGITLFADSRGKGCGRDAVAQFTELLFEKGMQRVQASTALDNVAMRRVLEVIGYEYEGVLRSYAPSADGAREDYALYAVVADGRATG